MKSIREAGHGNRAFMNEAVERIQRLVGLSESGRTLARRYADIAIFLYDSKFALPGGCGRCGNSTFYPHLVAREDRAWLFAVCASCERSTQMPTETNLGEGTASL